MVDVDEAARKKMQAAIRNHPLIKATEAEMAMEAAEAAQGGTGIDLDELF